jgi:hypothetical protein
MDRLHVFAAVTAISFGVSAPLATSASAEAPSGATSVDVTCAGATVSTSGWPDGTLVMFGLGSPPPGGLTVNATTFWSAALTERSSWMLQVTPPDQPAVLTVGEVDCTPTLAPEPAPEVVEAPAPLFPEAPAVLAESWHGLELAPPW